MTSGQERLGTCHQNGTCHLPHATVPVFFVWVEAFIFFILWTFYLVYILYVNHKESLDCSGVGMYQIINQLIWQAEHANKDTL